MARAMGVRLLAGLLCAAIAGASHARSVNPRHLDPVDPPVEYRLEADVSVEGAGITYTVRAGLYRLAYRDRRGAYLLGEGQCLHLAIHTARTTGSNDWTCGVFLPADPRRGASFFRIRPAHPDTPDTPDMGLVVRTMIRYGEGSFDWPDKAESAALRERLVPHALP